MSDYNDRLAGQIFDLIFEFAPPIVPNRHTGEKYDDKKNRAQKTGPVGVHLD